jgi:hypothetical protein
LPEQKFDGDRPAYTFGDLLAAQRSPSECFVASFLLIAMLAIQSLTALAMVAVPVLAPSGAPDLDVPVTFTGMFIGVVFLAAVWATLWSGSLVRRFGAIRLSQAALLACAAGLLVLPPIIIAFGWRWGRWSLRWRASAWQPWPRRCAAWRYYASAIRSRDNRRLSPVSKAKIDSYCWPAHNR